MKTLIQQLMRFDFTEGEAKVYASLIQQPHVSGYEAAKNSGVARSKVYEILDSLNRKGAVVISTGDKSKLYSGVPLPELIQLLKRRMKLELEELELMSKKFQQPKESQEIWTIADYQAALQKALTIIQETKEHLLIQIWMEDLTEEIEEAVLEKRRQGVNVLFILYDRTGKYETKIPHIFRHGFEESKLKAGARWLTIASDEKMMMHMSIITDNNIHAIFTGHSSMTYFAQEYILHDAYCLNLIDRLKERVQDAFGSDMEEIRNVFL